jgi:hypothetical protein
MCRSTKEVWLLEDQVVGEAFIMEMQHGHGGEENALQMVTSAHSSTQGLHMGGSRLCCLPAILCSAVRGSVIL